MQILENNGKLEVLSNSGPQVHNSVDKVLMIGFDGWNITFLKRL